ncbi:MAG TPA: carboxypeptidase-like regulatory domain-containing protein [Terriglobales bacterium]|nr:carboxypeptidase-like regulatory domain-containing protein [Terriglobales bacterium]
MKDGPLRIFGAMVLAAAGACSLLLASSAAAQAKLAGGKLAGVVRDSAGTPQMGASVEVVPELAGELAPLDYLTNTQGIFRGDKLPPGLYTVRVTLAGFLPTLHQHIRINPNLTTMVRIQLESMFAALDQLRRQPGVSANDSDDWKWVLRSAPGMRPVLQWEEGDIQTAALSSGDVSPRRPRLIFQITDGAMRPGSVSNVASAPGTVVAYDQKLNGMSRLLIAGQMSHQDQTSGGVATVWLPSGMLGEGPYTAFVVRSASLGPSGMTFRGVRIAQGGALALGDRTVLSYGGEYVLVGLGKATASLRPHLTVQRRIGNSWRAELVFASEPAGPNPLEPEEPTDTDAALSAAINELDAFPAVMLRDGKPVLQSGWHEEVSAQRKLGARGTLELAAFHDDNRNTAVFGRGQDLPEADYFQDVFSSGFAYDGGSGSSWGGRIALQEKLSNDLEFTTVYALAGALAPGGDADGILRDELHMVSRHSLGANMNARIERSGTRFSAGYKWIDGAALSRVDSYGESLYQMDPYFHIAVRQSLPKFGPGHWEAMADCDNLLAQGYVRMNTGDGQVVLVPAFRTFRGGVSVQF